MSQAKFIFGVMGRGGTLGRAGRCAPRRFAPCPALGAPSLHGQKPIVSNVLGVSVISPGLLPGSAHAYKRIMHNLNFIFLFQYM